MVQGKDNGTIEGEEMTPDMPIETHGLRIKQLEVWKDTAGKRLHDLENDNVGLLMHAKEQTEKNRDYEDRLRKVETSTLKNGLVIAIIGAGSGIAASALIHYMVK